MICFQINPTERTIQSVEIPAIPAGYDDDPRLLDEETGDVIYTQKNSEATHGFILEGVRAPLIGVAYIVGTSEDGDDIPPKVAYDWLVDHIDFGSVVPNGSIRMFTGSRNIRQVQN